jgi:hypothetical protein
MSFIDIKGIPRRSTEVQAEILYEAVCWRCACCGSGAVVGVNANAPLLSATSLVLRRSGGGCE